MNDLLVIGLATSLDRYAWVPALRPGAINRPREVVARAGGKGLNAARAAAGLGLRVRTVALIGGPTGTTVRALTPPLDVRFVDSGVETRQCLCLLDDAGELTEIYEPVRAVPESVWPECRAAVEAELAEARLVAISGRLPAGLPPDALAQIVDLAHDHGRPILVDADGPALAAAVRHRPDLVKVNAEEARAVTGDAADPLAALVAMGARSVVITAGATGADGLDAGGRRYSVRHEPIPGALPVGSGDAFLAGLAVHRRDGPLSAAALRFAAAAARANARHLPAGDVTLAAVQAEVPSVRVG